MVSSTRFRYVAQTAIRLRIRLRIPEKMTDGSGSDEEPEKMNGRLQVRWRTQREWTASDPGLDPEEDERTASDPATDPKKMNGSGSGLTDPKIWRHRSRASVIFWHWSGAPQSFALKRSASHLLHSEIGSRASSKKRFYFLESQQFRIFSRNRSLLIRTKRATQRTNRPLPTIETQVNQVVYIFF